MYRFSLRHAIRDPWHTALLLAILSLGIATFLSIRIANRSAVQGFDLFNQAIGDQSDFSLVSREGPLRPEDLSAMREALGNQPVNLFPVIESNATHPDLPTAHPFRTVRLLGLDVVQILNLATGDSTNEWQLAQEDIWPLLRNPRSLFITRKLATEWKTGLGEQVNLVIRGQPVQVEISGLLPEATEANPIPANLAVADLHGLLKNDSFKGIDRVDGFVEPGPLAANQLERARELLATPNAHWVLQAPDAQTLRGSQLTSALRMNLTVLSLIALLVGIYLMMQAIDSTVSRRRREIATLRSLGLSPADIRRLWFSEAVLYGIIGTGLGCLLSLILSQFTTAALTSTVSALYQQTALTAIHLTPVDLLVAFSLGIGGSLLAAWYPARDAAATPPAQFLRTQQRIPPFPLFDRPLWGIAGLLLGTVFTFLPPLQFQSNSLPLFAFGSAFLWLLGGTLVAAASLPIFAKAIHRLHLSAPSIRLASSRLANPTSRHQLALAGFFVAFSMAAAIAFLIQSFESTVTRWLEQRLKADLFISAIGFQGADSDQRIPEAAIRAIKEHPSVLAVDTFRSAPVELNGRPTLIGGSNWDLLGTFQELMWIDPPSARSFQSDSVPTLAYINENTHRRFDLGKGDVFELSTPKGPRKLQVAGVHADFASEHGMILIPIQTLRNWFSLEDFHTASVFLNSGTDVESVRLAISEQFPGLEIRQNAELKLAALGIFHQTFLITKVLQLIGLFVALSGLVLTILALLRDSAADIRLKRTLGMNRFQIATTMAIEGIGLAVAGLLTGFPMSLALGFLLLHVINPQSFGWTLSADFPVMDFLLLSWLSILLAGLSAYATTLLFLRQNKSPRRWTRVLRPAFLLGLIPFTARADTVPLVTGEGFAVPQPRAELPFPRTHASHPDFKIEWWYLTGHLFADSGDRYGFQATFFRYGLQARSGNGSSSFGTDTAFLSHFALADIRQNRFFADEEFVREGWEASASTEKLDVRIRQNRIQTLDANHTRFSIEAAVGPEVQMELSIDTGKPWVRFGPDGTSRKGPAPEARSYYISFTRMPVTGRLHLPEGSVTVSGTAWMDHEIASNQLDESLAGWDWTAIQLEDNWEVKAYILRKEDGTPSPFSALIWISPEGELTYAFNSDAGPVDGIQPAGWGTFRWDFGEYWTSPLTNAAYPIAPIISTSHPQSGKSVQFRLQPFIENQELHFPNSGTTYWEGACQVVDANGKAVGNAYLELVGYHSAIAGLR